MNTELKDYINKRFAGDLADGFSTAEKVYLDCISSSTTNKVDVACNNEYIKLFRKYLKDNNL